MTARINIISAREAAESRDLGSAVFLDVRTALEHGEVHVSGARLEPLDRLEAGRLAAELAGRKVVVVCRSGSRAKLAAGKLAEAGLEVDVLDGGMQGWVAAGLPVERGKRVVSLERQVRVAAGLMVVTGVVMGWLVHPAFYGLSAFVGAGLVFAGLTDWCGMGLLLAKAPWNRVRPVSVPGQGPGASVSCAR